MGALTVTERVTASRAYADLHGLVYVPCFRKANATADSPFLERPLDAPEAIKLLIAASRTPLETIERWWNGVGLEQLKLSLCVHCRCQPVANAAGQCWWCEQRPWTCQ